jgi:hypothetical protein
VIRAKKEAVTEVADAAEVVDSEGEELNVAGVKGGNDFDAGGVIR